MSGTPLRHLLATILLLVIGGAAHASDQYVSCLFKTDWNHYKAGGSAEFGLPEINADIVRTYREHCQFLLYYFDMSTRGEIDTKLEQTLIALKGVLDPDKDYQDSLRLPSVGINLWISDSPGGDVDVALRIGKILREMQASVSIGSRCVSSCVLVLAAGVDRNVTGAKVGVHRPYFSDLPANLSAAEVSRVYAERRDRVIKYLTEMNVPSSLWELMEQTPPESVHYLTPTELSKYQLNSEDPVFNERRTAAYAAMRGITSAESRARSAQADSICGTLDTCSKYHNSKSYGECVDKWTSCTSAIFWGLSLPEYTKRAQQARQQCGNLADNDAGFTACFAAQMLGK